jgi:hypothetical protein
MSRAAEGLYGRREIGLAMAFARAHFGEESRWVLSKIQQLCNFGDAGRVE